EERQLDEALETRRAYGCSDAVMRALALASEEPHPRHALALYAELVEREVNMTGRHAYEEACRMIDRMRGLRDRLGEREAHTAYVAELMNRHKAKRSFVKLLGALPSGNLPLR
ncbi:MAG TPA: hypothetical protein VF511_10130, partial [Chthoniobacterales bacterium]